MRQQLIWALSRNNMLYNVNSLRWWRSNIAIDEREVDYWKSEVNAFIVELSVSIPPVSNMYIYVKQKSVMFYEHLNVYIHIKDKQLPTRGFIFHIKACSCIFRVKSPQYVIHGWLRCARFDKCESRRSWMALRFIHWRIFNSEFTCQPFDQCH